MYGVVYLEVPSKIAPYGIAFVRVTRYRFPMSLQPTLLSNRSIFDLVTVF